jgi:TRAP-type uncharacterized transport system fused permease subunit
LKTGVNAFKLAIAAFLVPYVFVYNPALLMIDVNVGNMIFIVITAVIGIVGVASAVSAFFITNQSFFERIIFFVGGLLMVIPGAYTDFIGIAILAVGYLIQKKKIANQRLDAGAGA